MNEGGTAANCKCIFKVEFIVVVVEVQFEVFVGEKVAGMGRDDTQRHHLGPLPKPEQTLFSVESLNYASQTQVSSTSLNVSLQEVSS